MKNKWLAIITVSLLAIVLAFTQVACSAKPTLVNKTTHLYTPPAFNDQYYFEWNAFQKELLETDAKTIVIHVTGSGGDVSIGKDILRSIQEAKDQGKEIVVIATRFAASMHTALICVADNASYTKDTILVYHAVITKFTPRGGKSVTIINSDTTHELFDECVRKGILSQREIDRMIDGYNLYRRYQGGVSYISAEEKRNLSEE